jgi:hypothetical protein
MEQRQQRQLGRRERWLDAPTINPGLLDGFVNPDSAARVGLLLCGDGTCIVEAQRNRSAQAKQMCDDSAMLCVKLRSYRASFRFSLRFSRGTIVPERCIE